MSLKSLPGLVSGSLRWSTSGSDGWLLNIMVLRSLFLAGPSTDRAPAGALRPLMNFWTLLLVGLAIQIHGSEQRGRKGNGWRSLSHIVELCCFWTVWSRFKIRPVHKKDGYVSLPSRRFCASLLLSIRGFASSPRGCRSLILQITSAPRPCVVSWNNYPTRPARSCSERWGLKRMRRSCEVPATSSAAIVLLFRCWAAI